MLFRSFANRSPYRATVSDLLSSLFKKERPWANRSHYSLQKSDESQSLFNKEWREWFTRFFRANPTFTIKKRAIRLKKFLVFTMFLTVFHCFSPFYAQELIATVALCSVPLFWRATRVIRSRLLCLNSDREQFAPVAL